MKKRTPYILVTLSFLLGFSVVFNLWLGFEFIHFSKEYRALLQQSGKKSTEIERKWLVDISKIPYDLEKKADVYELTQTYLNFSPEMRVRNISDERYVITIKTGLSEKSGLKRGEQEYDITKEEYEHLLNKQEGNTIRKTRYQLEIDGKTWAFDIFHDQLDGLAYLEIEFDSTDEANNFQAPDWVGKDVTNDINYKNQKLAQFGIPASFAEDSKE